jgi:RNA recognition motif-containing protein
VALKLQGVPYRATEEECEEFFQDYKLVAGSIKFGLQEDGRKNGYAAALFESEDQASEAAQGKEGQEIGPRFIRLRAMKYSEYKAFADPDAP